MKKLLLFGALAFGLNAACQVQEKIFVTNQQDLINNNLFGTYKTDGYYFYVVKSNEHLFELRYEMNWYDEVSGQSNVLDKCQGVVDFKKGKLLLQWSPCNNKNSFQDIQILSHEVINFEFYKENGEVYLKFLGTYPPHKVD
jgi:hypothetical protein